MSSMSFCHSVSFFKITLFKTTTTKIYYYYYLIYFIFANILLLFKIIYLFIFFLEGFFLSFKHPINPVSFHCVNCSYNYI